MKFMGWLREKLNGRVGGRDDKFAAAMAATDSLTVMARSLRQQLEPYKQADDPFAAMTRAVSASRSYEESQEAAIFRGPAH
jgi:hypothetical protein